MKDKEDGEEHGIPEIGVQIPLYPNAGDVQAPTPSPFEQKPYGAGVGFFNDGGQGVGRKHQRTRSGREIFTGPPGSYGLHGHGKVDRDQFERSWYDSHPGEREKESRGAYGPFHADARKEWALSSDDLNRLVHQNAGGVGVGASQDAISTPDEVIGYMASEEYTSRIQSPRPASTVGTIRPRTSSNHAESPLRKMSFPAGEISPAIKQESPHEQALDIEAEDDVIHVEPLSRSQSRVTGGYDPPAEDLVPRGGNSDAEGGNLDEHGYGTPILASDEVAKTPGREWLQPAVPPEQERRGSTYLVGVDSEGHPVYQSGHRHSRPSSRSNSLTGLHRFSSHDDVSYVPLADVKEYEPLFPDEEGNLKTKDGKIVEKAKRPDYLARHHFPSKDVWEDTPDSLMYVTTVETPQPDAAEKQATKAFEPPEAEAARKSEITEADQEDFLSEHTKKFAKSWFNKDAMADMATRPGLQPRFPSQDVWEDSPSESLITTVITPEPERQASPQEAKKIPEIPARPVKGQPPSIPARPAKPREISPVDKKAPLIPERPKPKVPERPSKPLTRDSLEQVPLAKTLSIGSTGSAGDASSEGTVVEKKAPPPRPAKQFGGIKGGFISELQNKLQLGPQAPKKETPPPEEEKKVEEQAPLADARKGRARGPQRRKPGVSPSLAAGAAAPAVATEKAPKKVTFDIAQPWSVWEIGDNGSVEVGKPMNPVKTLVPEEPSFRNSSAESIITPSLPDDGSGPAPEDGYFSPGSPSTSTKAVAQAAPETVKEDLQGQEKLPNASLPATAPEHKDESLVEMHSGDSASQEATATQIGETRVEHGIEDDGKENEKLTALDDGASAARDVVVKSGEDVPSFTATAGEEQH